MAQLFKWRSLDTYLPYDNRDQNSNLRCGQLCQNRIRGSQDPYGTLQSDWDWYTDRDDIYGMSFVGKHLEDWVDAVGPDVARMYVDRSHWRSLNSYGDNASIAFQLLGQDYLDGNYNGDITTHPRVNVIAFTAGYYGHEWWHYQGVSTDDIINQNPNSSNDTVTQWDKIAYDRLCTYYNNSSNFFAYQQMYSIFVVYETTPGSEYFFYILDTGAGYSSSTDVPDYLGAPARQVYTPAMIFGFYRMQDVNTDLKTTKGADSGWMGVSRYFGNNTIKGTNIFTFPLNQNVFDKDFYLGQHQVPGPLDPKYQMPYGYDSSVDYNTYTQELTELMGMTDYDELAEADMDAWGYRPAGERYKGSHTGGWGNYTHSFIKNAPIYSPMGEYMGKTPPSILVGPAAEYEIMGNRAIKILDGTRYLMVPPNLAIKID